MNDYTKELLIQEEDNSIFSNAFRYAAIGMALVALNGKWLKVNRSLCEMLGYSEDEILEKTFQDITHPDDIDEDLVYVTRMLAGVIDTYQMEKRYFHKEGYVINILLSVSLVVNKDGSPRFFISQIQDITRRKQAEEELLKISREDTLTGIANRRYFFEHASREMIRGRRFNESQTLAMLDVDYFKNINDTFGHETGDVVLKKMAGECKKILREVDIFGRIGGEEFGILFLNTDKKTSQILAERLRSHIEKIEVITSAGKINFTVSIGMVSFRGGNKSIDERLSIADQALYQAKESGRNRIEIISEDPSAPEETPESIHSQLVRLMWKDEYASGNLLIDSQHRNLFTCANELLNAIITGQTDKIVLFFSNNLLNHTVQHFFDEEKILYEYKFPEFQSHYNIHRELEKKMSQTIANYKNDKVHVGELFSFLVTDIILEHMVLEDQKFFSYLD
jgi:diguanylate cyclase (GGDEF)-like protein/PAS domain S-box-containing protein/hemerythrin-like metal-binding protein